MPGDPLFVAVRRADRDGARPERDLSLAGKAVAHDEPRAVLVALVGDRSMYSRSMYSRTSASSAAGSSAELAREIRRA